MPFLTLNNLFHIPNYSTFSAKGKNFYQNKRKILVKSSINMGKIARERGLRLPGTEAESVLFGNAPSQFWSEEGLYPVGWKNRRSSLGIQSFSENKQSENWSNHAKKLIKPRKNGGIAECKTLRKRMTLVWVKSRRNSILKQVSEVRTKECYGRDF